VHRRCFPDVGDGGRFKHLEMLEAIGTYPIAALAPLISVRNVHG
jgi:hypothetical protein